MSGTSLISHAANDIQWWEDNIPIRGCQLSLPQIKAAYRELNTLTRKEGQQDVATVPKFDGETEDEFAERKNVLLDGAFRLTVSVVGFEGQTKYGETEQIFDSQNLPFPIKAVYFTNENSYKKYTNGNIPPNRFSVLLQFDKPPLFDFNSLTSEPTPNNSNVSIQACNSAYFHAIRDIANSKFKSKKKWYSFIHESFAYDVGLWFLALPYGLYWVTVYADYFLPNDGDHSSFRVAFYIYGMGISLVIYRALFGYLKWAFPVNILEENKDRATRHRVALAAIVVGIFSSIVKSAFGYIPGI